MSNLIEHPDSGNGADTVDSVRVGDRQTQVSLKTYQDVYHQITGRTEQIRKRYTENLLIDIGEIEQLNYKIRQLCDVHHVVAGNDTVTVFHAMERKEQFTSFDRFRAYNSNTSSETVNLVLRYNFSIIPAGNSRAQEYVVDVRLTSKIAALKQLKEQAPPFIRGDVMNYMVGPIVEVTVDYADYVIARGFMEAVDEWVKGCRKNPKNKTIRFLQFYSHHIPDLMQMLAALLVTYFAYQAVPGLITGGSDPATWAKFAIIYIGGAYVIVNMVKRVGQRIENAVDSFTEISYVKINKGDELLVEDIKDSWAWIRLVFNLIFTIALGIVSSKLEKLI